MRVSCQEFVPSKSWERFEVEGADLIVCLPKAAFKAVYYKATDQSQLILRHRTKTDNHELLAKAWIAATVKARELGWIKQRTTQPRLPIMPKRR